MASSAKHLILIFFLSLLSTQLVHARELHSFNKVTPKTSTTTITPSTTTTTTTTTIPKEPIAEAPNTENEPSFMPESQNNYGLFGQDSDNLPPTTTTETTNTPPFTTTNVPYKPQMEEEPNSNPNYYNNDGYMTESQNMGEQRFGGRGYTNGNNYYNNNGGGVGGNNHNVQQQQQSMSGTKTLENGKYFYDVQNENSNYQSPYQNQRGVYYNDNNNFDQEDLGDPSLMDQGYTTPTTTTTNNNNNHNHYLGANYQNTQKQGMSDTRFLENGKYFYDVKNEKSYYPNMYLNQNQRGPYYYDNSQPEDFSDPTLMDQGYTTNSNHNNNFINGRNYQNTQQQGMSDTRFLENGKYFYDVQNENKYQNRYTDSRSSYDNQGHYGNNENLYENYDSMDGYQNQEEFQDGHGQYEP